MNFRASLLCAFAVTATASDARGIVTLYALDPLASTFSFGDGDFGHVIQDGIAKNRNSDIDFGQYNPDKFSVGIEGERLGAIVDLGTAAGLQRRYGYRETVGNPQGFSSLRLVEGKLVIVKDPNAGTVQPLLEAASLSATKSMSQSSVVRGHIYLVRITDPRNQGFERIAKLLVLDYQPHTLVTFRWETLK